MMHWGPPKEEGPAGKDCQKDCWKKGWVPPPRGRTSWEGLLEGGLGTPPSPPPRKNQLGRTTGRRAGYPPPDMGRRTWLPPPPQHGKEDMGTPPPRHGKEDMGGPHMCAYFDTHTSTGKRVVFL